MAKERISKRTVDGLEVDPARDVYLWDTEIKGFAVKLTPAGTRTYLFQWDIPNGRTRRYTIGRHGPLTAELARVEAKRVAAEVALGRDPSDEKAAKGDGMTLAELWTLYLAEGCTTKKDSTTEADVSRYECHLQPLLGKKRVKDITRADVERTMAQIANGATATKTREKVPGKLHGSRIVKGGKGAAVRTMGLLGSMMTFAVRRELRPDNPTAGLEKYKGKKIERYLTGEELGRLGAALEGVERMGYYPPCGAAIIRLLTLTGCRTSEVVTLEWEWVDLARGLLMLPDSKTGQKSVTLSQPAIDLLTDWPGAGRYVFPSEETGRPYAGLQKVWAAVRKASNLPGVRLHDLRHTFASVGASAGDSLFILGAILGHKTPSTTQRYAHLSDDPKRSATNRIAGTIAAAMSPGPKASTEASTEPAPKAPTPTGDRPNPPAGASGGPSSTSAPSRSVRGPMRAARASSASRGRRDGA